MRISKVYTRTGDAGKTRLAGGQQVFKDDRRVEAYGSVDELNAVVGLRVRSLPDVFETTQSWQRSIKSCTSSRVSSLTLGVSWQPLRERIFRICLQLPRTMSHALRS